MSVLVTTALLFLTTPILHTVAAHVYAIPSQAKRDDNRYRLKSYGTGYKTALASAANGTSGLTIDGDDVLYSVDVVLGGHQVAVQLDTGSTDLWVFAPDGSVKTTNSTNIAAQFSYGSGALNGTIQFADFQIGQYTVTDQAFLNATEMTDFDVMFTRNVFGILGLGFSERTPGFTPSEINAQLQRAYGNGTTLGESVIGNIFKQNTSLPNYFDIHIGRSSDLEDVSEGLFSIGEHVPGYETVEQRPKLPRISEGRWGVPLDGFQVNGKNVSLGGSSVVPGAPSGKLVAVLDTGATLPQVPWNVFKELYLSIPGGIYDNGNVGWFLPCDAAANLTVIMGDEPIPIHPLDITRVVVLPITLNGTLTNTTVCVNAWQAFDLPASFTGLDILMGDSFLRNVYASYDFGDEGTEDNSFIQLLPTTDADAAYTEFFKMRAEALAQLPPAYAPADLFKWAAQDGPSKTVSATHSTNSTDPTDAASPTEPTDSANSVDNAERSQSSAVGNAMLSSDSDIDDGATDTLNKWGPLIIGLLAANLFVVFVLCVVGVVLCVRKRKGSRVKNTVSFGPPQTRGRDGAVYSVLNEDR